MRFSEFEFIMSVPRMGRYLKAVGGITKNAMTLYRLNLRLSQELFTIESCFEIALRNKIDQHYSIHKGSDWLRNAALPGGMFNTRNCGKTPFIISQGLRNLLVYSPPKLLALMDFGFWRYMFAPHQFYAGGQSLLMIFPSKLQSSSRNQYNHNLVFLELEKLNNLRNRLAHHEPVCFTDGAAVKNITYAQQHYNIIMNLFNWMQIDEATLLYGLDHINTILTKIDAL